MEEIARLPNYLGSIAKGRLQLLTQDVDEAYLRKAGGGRKLVKKNTRYN